MSHQIIKEFILFKTQKSIKTPREILNIFSDIFVELEDMGGWLSFASNQRLYNIESENEIEVKGDKIVIEFKSKLDSYGEKRLSAEQNEVYLFLKSNLDNLIERFEKNSGCRVSKIGGSVDIISYTGGQHTVEIMKLKSNVWKNKLKLPELDSILKPEGATIDNICIQFEVSI